MDNVIRPLTSGPGSFPNCPYVLLRGCLCYGLSVHPRVLSFEFSFVSPPFVRLSAVGLSFRPCARSTIHVSVFPSARKESGRNLLIIGYLKLSELVKFQSSVERNLELHWFLLDSLHDWFKKLAPFSQPIRGKNITNLHLVARIFPLFRRFASFDFKFSLTLLNIFDSDSVAITLVLVLRYSFKTRSKSA